MSDQDSEYNCLLAGDITKKEATIICHAANMEWDTSDHPAIVTKNGRKYEVWAAVCDGKVVGWFDFHGQLQLWAEGVLSGYRLAIGKYSGPLSRSHARRRAATKPEFLLSK